MYSAITSIGGCTNRAYGVRAGAVRLVIETTQGCILGHLTRCPILVPFAATVTHSLYLISVISGADSDQKLIVAAENSAHCRLRA